MTSPPTMPATIQQYGVTDPFEDGKHIGISVDVPLEHFPVINSRVTRFPRIANHKTALNFSFVDSQMFTIDAIGIEMNA